MTILGLSNRTRGLGISPRRHRAAKSVAPATIVQDGLIAEWRFDDGAGQSLTDYKGGFHGELGSGSGADGADPTWTVHGLSFNGANTVNLPSIPGVLGIDIVFKPESAIDKNTARTALIGHADALSNGIVLGSFTGHLGNEIAAVAQQSAQGYSAEHRRAWISSSGSISAAWHLLQVDWQGGSPYYNLVLDGTDIANATVGTPQQWLTNQWSLGSRQGNGVSDGFTGEIAYVLFYSIGRSSAQQTQNHQALMAILAARGIALPLAAGGPQNAFVDSQNGDDGNDGAIPERALRTLAALTPQLTDRMRINLARGSVWREMLDASPYVHVDVFAYGPSDEPMPCLDASDLIDPSDWSATAGRTNVYEVSFSYTNSEAGKENFVVWEDGEDLVWYDNLDDVAGTPGSFHTPSSPTTGTVTIYVHASDSGDPAANGKTYERNARPCGLRLGDDSSATNIWTRRNLHHNGSLTCGYRGTLTDCLAESGLVHNVLVGPDTTLDGVIAWKMHQPSRLGSATHFVAHRNTFSGESVTFRRCVAFNYPYRDHFNLQAFYAHRGSSGELATITFDRCFAYLTQTSFDAANVDSREIIDCYSEGIHHGVGGAMPTTVRGLTNLADRKGIQLKALRLFASTGVYATLDIEDFASATEAISVGALCLNGVVSVRHSTISPGGPLFDRQQGGGEFEVTLLDSVVAASTQVFKDTTAVAADRNVYGTGCQFGEPNGGTVHTTLASWQAATGNDLGSAHADPLLAEDILTTGNFSLSPASPAFGGGRAAGARKWVTPPDVDGLIAQWSHGIYAHPLDDVGGAEMVVRN